MWKNAEVFARIIESHDKMLLRDCPLSQAFNHFLYKIIVRKS